MARDHAILKREIAQPRRAPSLPDLLTYLMDQHGLSRADLVPPLGTPSRGSEGRRALRAS
jgi:antitoxin component HigA of HigAB toxin-antitoxin module